MSKNRVIVAAAGAGKTSFIVENALSVNHGKVLITTFTEANAAGIADKIMKKRGALPSNVKIQTWYSFLIQNGVKPYQGGFSDAKIRGLNLVSGQSAMYSRESDISVHYFDKDKRIYSDKLAKFVVKCNHVCGGATMERLSRIYSHIYIDEFQDLAAYDLEFLKLLFLTPSYITLVGDPRQSTYVTSNSPKHNKYKKSAILNFFIENNEDIEIDDELLPINHRCISAICELSNQLYPEYNPTLSANKIETHHDGLFLVRAKDLRTYLERYSPIQLRDSRKTVADINYEVYNFGESKGLTFDRTIIYPTSPIRSWLKDNSKELTDTSRAKLYVAITRARQSVAFIFDYKTGETISGFENFDP